MPLPVDRRDSAGAAATDADRFRNDWGAACEVGGVGKKKVLEAG